MDKINLMTDRFNRIQRAVNLEKQDRIPVVLEYSGFASDITRTPMCEFIGSPAKATKIMIQAYKMIGEADGINYGSFFPYGLCELFGAKVKVPGFDLPDNDMWQVHETELMKIEDYDEILDIGWENFFGRFMKEKILNDINMELFNTSREILNVREEWAKIDIPVLSGGDITTPFDLLCGARSLEKFFMDLIQIPDKIEKVMDVIVPTLVQDKCRQAKEKGYSMIWVGGWRTAPCMISPQMWDRFVWPYFSTIVNEVTDSGLIAILHLDSNWNRELKRFRELPEREMIMALDGDTDIFQAKKQLGDHLCIMGDVPAALLAFGKKDEVYSYCRKLINEIGPEGFILHSGCDIPTNAKLENVQAMVEIVMEA
ncbi:MAG: uroporphyrinogen decarboxylase [Deltaproteobacteria bacterium]|nr:MAG: uroporphyrinogen decarboxylase [Deltaproteobacteria bacterium]RLC25668.1 MAG: uroporphyrinogen decarboxylase [Deltaproteobacteria bacterium]